MEALRKEFHKGLNRLSGLVASIHVQADTIPVLLYKLLWKN
jgi:hypothetical protein